MTLVAHTSMASFVFWWSVIGLIVAWRTTTYVTTRYAALFSPTPAVPQGDTPVVTERRSMVGLEWALNWSIIFGVWMLSGTCVFGGAKAVLVASLWLTHAG